MRIQLARFELLPRSIVSAAGSRISNTHSLRAPVAIFSPCFCLNSHFGSRHPENSYMHNVPTARRGQSSGSIEPCRRLSRFSLQRQTQSAVHTAQKRIHDFTTLMISKLRQVSECDHLLKSYLRGRLRIATRHQGLQSYLDPSPKYHIAGNSQIASMTRSNIKEGMWLSLLRLLGRTRKRLHPNRV